jgi:hypothetical protein
MLMFRIVYDIQYLFCQCGRAGCTADSIHCHGQSYSTLLRLVDLFLAQLGFLCNHYELLIQKL